MADEKILPDETLDVTYSISSDTSDLETVININKDNSPKDIQDIDNITDVKHFRWVPTKSDVDSTYEFEIGGEYLTVEVIDIFKNAIGHWSFTNGTATDETENNNDGNINGATFLQNGGPDNKGSFVFNGSSSIEMPNFSFPSSNFCLSFWLKDDSTTEDHRRWIGNSVDAFDNNLFIIRENNNNNNVEIGIGDKVSEIPTTFKGSWTHFVLNVDYGNIATLYINKQEIGSINISSPNFDSSMFIGGYYQDGEYVVGEFTEIVVYDKLLSQSDIDNLYNYRIN